MSEELIAKSEATRQVRLMGRMMATLYYHMSRQLIDELGPEKAKEIISSAISAMGKERGENQREKVLAAGYEHTPQNYIKVPDLPALGWELEKPAESENATHILINYCPFSEVWKEKDFAEFGRLYCAIDQAKYAAFHPDSELVTLKNALAGADCCEMVCRSKNPQVADGSGI